MKTKQIKDTLKIADEKNKQIKSASLAEQCKNEVNAVLEKYKCDLVCQPQNYYGQQVFIPVIVPKQ